ncbi:hypothetical protein TNCV_4517541 [Trichonephila clavipes]|nr:hypothetical protein TNCV_4517541 [Trichonephila clavipes]
MSPDLNPIQYVRDALEPSIGTQRPASTTINELISALVQEWVRLPQGLIRTLINRCQSTAVLDKEPVS